MNFKELLSQAIDTNTKIIITGKSGWGKSEMIQQVAEEKGMELIDFRLSEVLPEDIVGVPKVKDDYYEYVPPKWLYDVVNNPDKKYLLFLDEITQGTPEVLNICYKIFDKVTRVGNYTLENVSVVGATNYSNESNYLNDLPEPLKKRACMIELDHDDKLAANYIANKYNIEDESIIKMLRTTILNSNPRSTEKALNLIQLDANKNLIIPYIGYENYKNLAVLLKASKRPEGLTNLDAAICDITNGSMVYENKTYKLIEPKMLAYKYKLSEEEMSIVMDEWPNRSTNVDASRTFFTDYAIKNSANLKEDDILDIAQSNSFNCNLYIKKMSPSVDVMKEQLPALTKIMGLNETEFFTKYCNDRTITIQLMREFRKFLPWELLREQVKMGWITEEKIKEFPELQGVM